MYFKILWKRVTLSNVMLMILIKNHYLVLRMLRGFYLYFYCGCYVVAAYAIFCPILYLFIYSIFYISQSWLFYSDFVFNSFFPHKTKLILFYVYIKTVIVTFFPRNCQFKEVLSISQLPTSHSFEFTSCNLQFAKKSQLWEKKLQLILILFDSSCARKQFSIWIPPPLTNTDEL